MAYKKEKTDQEWNKIRFTNNLGPQIGGLLHDAVALAIAEKKSTSSEELKKDVKFWLDTLYEISEAKKKELTTPQLVTDEEALQAGIEFNKRIENDSKADDIKSALETEQEQEEEMDKREDQARKWGEDNKQ